MAVLLPVKLQLLLKKMKLLNCVDCKGDRKRRTPRGFIPVYVGEERKRYLVPTAAANSPAFVSMMDKYEDFIGSCGPLTVPCTAEAFEIVLRLAIHQMHCKY